MPASWPELPDTVHDIDGRWLVSALREGGADVSGAITEIDLEPITAAVGLMGEVTRLTLTWEAGADPGPPSIVAKFPSALPENRALGQALGLYAIEHRFYAELAGDVGLRTPQVWFTGADPDQGRFVVLLEDLGACTRYDQLDGAPLPAAEAMIDVLATMHARHWGMAPHPWLPEGSGEAIRPYGDLAAGAWPAFDAAISAFADDADRELVRRFVEGFDRLASRSIEQPQTLLHRDFRIDNALFDAGAPVVFDWTGAARGGAMYDLHYFIGSSLNRDDRARHWRSLVDRYLAALADQGVDLDDAPLDEMHKVNALFCLTIPVMAGGDALNTRDDKGDRLIEESLRRIFDHLHDLEAITLLD